MRIQALFQKKLLIVRTYVHFIDRHTPRACVLWREFQQVPNSIGITVFECVSVHCNVMLTFLSDDALQSKSDKDIWQSTVRTPKGEKQVRFAEYVEIYPWVLFTKFRSTFVHYCVSGMTAASVPLSTDRQAAYFSHELTNYSFFNEIEFFERI